MKKSLSLALLSLVVLAVPAFALPGPTSAVFAKGSKFTVSGYTGASTLSGFPVLVRIKENSPSGFSYDDLQSKATGDDIAFVDMDGTGLPFEIDTWNTNGTSLIWVRLPTMTNGTEFVMCWGSASSGKAVCNANPWSAYTGVWHMGETGTPSSSNPVTIHDSTANGLDGSTPVGGAASGSVVGGAWLISPDSNHDRSIRVPVGGSAADPAKKAAADALGTDFHASFWMRAKGVVQWANLICRRKGDKGTGWGFSFHENSGSAPKLMRVYAGSTTPATTSGNYNLGTTLCATDDVWKKVDVVWKYAANNNVQVADIYLNGAYLETVTCTETVNQQDTDIGIGCSTQDAYNKDQEDKKGRRVNAEMDEVRLGAFVPSADWIAADYATQASPSFLTAGMAEPYEETDDPVAGVQVSDVAYTNATVTAMVIKRGGTATMADVTVELSTTSDFASLVWSTNYTVNADGDVQVFPVTGLSFGTSYYLRAVVSNTLDAVLTTPATSFTTPTPGSPAGTASFLARGFTTMMASATTTSFGVGAASATMRLEASADADFATVIAGAETNATVGAAADLSVPGLVPGTAYHLRVRLRNEWGFETFLVLPDAATPAVPLESTGIGYTWSPDGSTIDFTFGVSAVYDGATCTAELSYGGTPQGSRTFSLPGSLTWPGVAAASAARPVTVTVTAVVDGTTYTETWTATVSPGSHAYAVSTLAELSSIALRVGDTVSLPSLARADDYYLPLDVRVLSLEEDGRTLKAIEPGFSAVCAMEWDAAAGAFVRNAAMGLAVCIPAAAGRVFLAEAGGADMNWSATAKWRCLSDSTVTGEYPDGAGDVAMVPLAKDKAITLDVDATVGAVYVGWDATVPASGTIRFVGANKTLTFDSGEKGVSGLFRIAGLNRSDVNSERPNFTLGSSGSGSRLVLAMPKGLVLDGGKHPDVANTTLRNVNNRINFRNGYGNVEVPAGQTFSIVNMDHAGWSDGQMYNCSTFIWNANFPLSGSGTVVYDTAALGFFDGALKNFAGTLVIRQKQRYTAYGVDSRGGGFWLKANVGYAAENATFVVEGESVYASNGSYSSTLGLATWGSSHGSGSWGPGDNSIGGKALVMAGGTLIQRGNNTKNWENNGIVENPNRSDALVVSNGYSVVEQTYQMTALPTNRLEFASLCHANRGTIRIATTDISNYEQKSLSTVSHCIVHGADAFAIGGGGADGSFTESVVPWIIGLQQWNNRAYFPHVGTRDGETNCLVMTTHPTSKSSLAAATDPDENVLVHEKTIALSADVTVNALYLNKNWSKGTALGAGRTLAVTSGGVILEGERCAIGTEADFTAGTAGTLRLPNEGYLYSTVQSAAEPNEVWAAIVAPKGLAISFPGYFRMGGDQAGIDEELAINGCDVTLGSETTGCTIDVPVRLESGAAKLRIGKAGSFCRQDLHLNDHAGSGPKFVPAAETEEPVHKLFVNGVSVRRGYYGSSEAAESMAEVASTTHPAFVDDNHFVGTGWIKVLTDEVVQPTLMILK